MKGVPIYDTRSKVAERMLHAGLSQVGINRSLSCLKIPPPDQKSSKRRGREIGPVIERIAKQTCERALEI